MISVTELKEILDKNFKGKAYNEDECTCEYLTEDGRKCVVGCFIPDGHEAQTAVNENGGQYSVHGLMKKYPKLLEKMPTNDIDALSRWQDWHDYLDEEKPIEVQKKELIVKALQLKIAFRD